MSSSGWEETGPKHKGSIGTRKKLRTSPFPPALKFQVRAAERPPHGIWAALRGPVPGASPHAPPRPSSCLYQSPPSPTLLQKLRCGGACDLFLSVTLSLVWSIFHLKYLSNDFSPPFPGSSPRVGFPVGHQGITSSMSLQGLPDFNLLSIISNPNFSAGKTFLNTVYMHKYLAAL